MKIGWLAVCLLVFAGCSGSRIYKPRPPLPSSVFRNQYLADLEAPDFQKAYDAIPDGPLKVARRNTIIHELVWLVDANYDPYETRFFTNQAYINTAADWITMGLNATGSITGTAATKSILAAISAGVIGANASYQSRFFDQLTRETIVAQMRASRATDLANIELGMSACLTMTACPSGSAYTINQAFFDIEAYYRDGTVISAIEAMRNATSQQNTAAQEKLKGLHRQ